MFNKPHAPTIPIKDADKPFNQKYNLAEWFNVPVFTAKTKVFQIYKMQQKEG